MGQRFERPAVVSVNRHLLRQYATSPRPIRARGGEKSGVEAYSLALVDLLCGFDAVGYSAAFDTAFRPLLQRMRAQKFGPKRNVLEDAFRAGQNLLTHLKSDPTVGAMVKEGQVVPVSRPRRKSWSRMVDKLEKSEKGVRPFKVLSDLGALRLLVDFSADTSRIYGAIRNALSGHAVFEGHHDAVSKYIYAFHRGHLVEIQILHVYIGNLYKYNSEHRGQKNGSCLDLSSRRNKVTGWKTFEWWAKDQIQRSAASVGSPEVVVNGLRKRLADKLSAVGKEQACTDKVTHRCNALLMVQ